MVNVKSMLVGAKLQWTSCKLRVVLHVCPCSIQHTLFILKRSVPLLNHVFARVAGLHEDQINTSFVFSHMIRNSNTERHVGFVLMQRLANSDLLLWLWYLLIACTQSNTELIVLLISSASQLTPEASGASKPEVCQRVGVQKKFRRYLQGWHSGHWGSLWREIQPCTPRHLQTWVLHAMHSLRVDTYLICLTQPLQSTLITSWQYVWVYSGLMDNGLYTVNKSQKDWSEVVTFQHFWNAVHCNQTGIALSNL